MGIALGIFGRRSKVALLRHLVRSGGQHTGRELARALRLDHKTCHSALQELFAPGVVTRRKVGTALAYALNWDHAIVREIVTPVFRKESVLIEDYAREARGILRVPVNSVILFGSVARSEEETESDVDLLFVVRESRSVREARRNLDRATLKLTRRYGSVPQVLLADRTTARRKFHSDPLFQEILRTGRVLFGESFASLMTDGR
jgi:predicted nucleotidyltransferase